MSRTTPSRQSRRRSPVTTAPAAPGSRRFVPDRTAQEREALGDRQPNPARWSPALWAIADAHPGSEASFGAVLWIRQNSWSAEEGRRAVDRLLAEHLHHPRIGEVCKRYGDRTIPPPSRAFRWCWKAARTRRRGRWPPYALARNLMNRDPETVSCDVPARKGAGSTTPLGRPRVRIDRGARHGGRGVPLLPGLRRFAARSPAGRARAALRPPPSATSCSGASSRSPVGMLRMRRRGATAMLVGCTAVTVGLHFAYDRIAIGLHVRGDAAPSGSVAAAAVLMAGMLAYGGLGLLGSRWSREAFPGGGPKRLWGWLFTGPAPDRAPRARARSPRDRETR